MDDGDCLDIGEISKRLAASRDPAEQLALWEGWHTISPPMRKDYERFVALGNQGANEIGFSDVGQLWRSGYDMPPDQIEAEVDRLWGQLKPLYDALHCDVRANLVEQYGAEIVPADGPIPAHLTGNLWAQDWSGLYDLVEPYPGKASLDVTDRLEADGWDAQKMTKTAEAFFVSLGLDPLPATFWERSMFVKPEGREVVCHASAWDPGWNDDLRIKMCIQPTQEDFVTLHHELGHLYYYHYYKDLPTLFRNGANDGFHEAIGDTIALSMTPTYLAKAGLLDAFEPSDEATVNAQMAVALERIAFLPLRAVGRQVALGGLRRPDRARGLQRGVVAAAPRDPGRRAGERAGRGALRSGREVPHPRQHAVSALLHRARARVPAAPGPVQGSGLRGAAARVLDLRQRGGGAKLKTLLSMGASQPWPDVLEAAIGERALDGSALVEYFEPLMAYLEEQNADRTCGW